MAATFDRSQHGSMWRSL